MKGNVLLHGCTRQYLFESMVTQSSLSYLLLGSPGAHDRNDRQFKGSPVNERAYCYFFKYIFCNRLMFTIYTEKCAFLLDIIETYVGL